MAATSRNTTIGAPLTRRFFARDSVTVARALIGQVLRCGDRAGVVVETEAYLGEHDQASHARFGRTRRNQLMYGPPGFAYVYLCYGMYELFNVVTGAEGQPEAVLVRALEPMGSLAVDSSACRGPGKLTRTLAITRAHNGVDLASGSSLKLCRGRRVPKHRIEVGPRVGVDYAGEWANAPLRFTLAEHPAVSGPRRIRRRA